MSRATSGLITMIVLWVLFTIAFCCVAHASDTAYCDYTKEKATAEQLQLQSPSVFAGLGRNSTATTNVLGIGVSESLSHFLKGRLSQQVGAEDCATYRVVNEIQKHVSYDLAIITKHINAARIQVDELALADINQLGLEESKRVAAGTSTVVILQQLRLAAERIELDEQNQRMQSATIYAPEFDPHAPKLSELLSLAKDLQQVEQHDLAAQQKLENWDVTLSVGVGSGASMTQLNTPFVMLQGTYSLGAPARDKHLDAAGKAYANWSSTATNAPINLGEQLHTQVKTATMVAVRGADNMNDLDHAIDQNIKDLGNADSQVAHAFKVQLLLEKINNRVELTTALVTALAMQSYLEVNFND